MKVSVLGAGNGGYALAFHLVQLGHEVLLFESGKFKDAIEPVQNTGCIVALKEIGDSQSVVHGVSKISISTTDIKEAIGFSNILMLIVPSFGQGPVFESALPYLTEKHILISLPGNFAFLEYLKIVKERSDLDVTKDLPFTLVETSTIPYACRKVEGNQVFISGIKAMLNAGVYPCSKTAETMKAISTLFVLNLQTSTNILEVGFCNLACVVHPSITIYNAGWIEGRKGDFGFYKDGASPAVLKLVTALDKERIAIAHALGFTVDSLLTGWAKWYGEKEVNTLEELVGTKRYETIKAPSSLNSRYLTEDLNFILLPIVNLARQYNVPTPVADAVVTSAKTLSGLSFQSARCFSTFPRHLKNL